MIYITRDTVSTVVVTLTQAQTITSPYFLFKIASNFNTDFTPVYVAPTDLSVTKERYNKFEFNLDIPKGEYTYFAYECIDPNPTDENDATGDYIETGLLICDSADDVNTDIYL